MPANSFSRRLGEHIVREKEAHDLSRNPEFASFEFLGYRTSAAAVELVALCDADGLTEGDVVRLRDEFFELVRRLPHDFGLKPRGRNPNGLLGFVFADGCPDPMARFIARQTRISHAEETGGVSVAWAIDVPNRRIYTHDNPVSTLPPVIVLARLVYPGLEYLESLLHGIQYEPDVYDVFFSYASEDITVVVELAKELSNRGVRVWLDKTVLKVGDSIRQAIDHGLANSRFGLVLVSRNFFRKQWPQRELDALIARETSEGRNLVLPVWHEIEALEVRTFSPTLADRLALKTSDGFSSIVEKLMETFYLPPTPKTFRADAARVPVSYAFNRAPPREGWTDRIQSDRIHILYLAANSVDRTLKLDWEVRQIQGELRSAKERDRLEFRLVVASTIDTVLQAMLDYPPTIVHFSGLGQSGGIMLRDEAGNPDLVSGKMLARLFMLFRETVNCVVLNACWSESQARAIQEHIPHVIGTRAAIPDDTAVAFSSGFYGAIGAGRDVPFAIHMGRARMEMEGGDGEELVVLN